MGRVRSLMPPKGKLKNASSQQHDKRHEVGLAAPGKRITKGTSASNGPLNGQPNGKPVSAVSPPALPPTGLNSGFRFPRAPDSTSPTDSTAPTTSKEHAQTAEENETKRTASVASTEQVDPCGDMADNPNDSTPLAAPSVEVQSPACQSTTQPRAPGSLSAVATILSYYPLRDAISILILLLSLPPTLGLVIQALFASLTFVPPTASISLSAMNIKEMFNASNLGYPALATILIVDLIFWAIWLPVWKPVQSIFLDLSQAVIAVSLSGAAASTGGPTYSIATCTLVVCMVHVLRYRAIHLTALDYLRSVIHKWDIGIPLDVPPFASSFLSTPSVEHGWVLTVIRTALGIHIVSQGVTTCIRRSLVRANERDQQNVPAFTKTDPEAAVGAEPGSRASLSVPEGAQQPHIASSTDGRPPGPSPSGRDGKARESNSKKKKKQANQVRSQQPLWAAIASTKVTFVKEMEQRDAADDLREAAAMDTNTQTTSAGSMNPHSNRIWISEVRDTEIYFTTDLSPEAATETTERMEEGVTVGAGIDKSKPFYVRVNGASWSSTRILPSVAADQSDGAPVNRFAGEIFGLAPLSPYHCEIVGIASGNVLCAASLITQAARTTEQTTAAPSQPQHAALRPSSPTTTLRQSIQSAEAKLNEVRNRTRKSKRDQKGVHSDIRKEINTLKTKLESSGGMDDKAERRLLQITQHKNQAEEATTELRSQIDSFGDIPEDDFVESEAKKRAWQTVLNARNAADKDLEHARSEAEREMRDMKAEISATESKREKLVSRHSQRAQELERLTSKKQAEMSARQKREYERAQVLQSRESEEQQFRMHIASMEAELSTHAAKTADCYQQLNALQSWPTNQPSAYATYSSPPTPEGTLPGTNGSLSPQQTNGFPSFGSQQQQQHQQQQPPPFQSPFHSSQPSITNPNPHGPRGRSSSMLSQYSGFTDTTGEEYPPTWPPPPTTTQASAGAAPGTAMDFHEGYGSGTNGSTGSNSPRPDAKPFVPGGGGGGGSGGSAGKMAPIGPPGRNRVQTPQSPGRGAGAVGSGR